MSDSRVILPPAPSPRRGLGLDALNEAPDGEAVVDRVRASYNGGRQLVVCGMHRSGTSLVASVLQRAGLDVGEQLIHRGPGNWRGHFEDRGFWGLHEDMLEAAGCAALTAGDDFAPPVDEGFDRRARELVGERSQLELWGWKDPRTCLFLDFWHERLPNASYVVLYRHPIEVVLSLMRRAGEFGETFAPLVGLRAWEVYNRRLLSFVDRYPERCFVAQVPALTLDLPGFVKQVAVAFDLPLRGGDGSDLFLPAELATGADAPATRPLWEWLLPDAMALYRRLEERAAVAAPAPAKAPTGALVGELIRHDLATLALQETGAQGAVAHLEALFEARLAEERRTAEVSIEGLQDQVREVRDQLREVAGESAVLRHRLAASEALCAAAAARRDEIAGTLAEIERSRTFSLVAAWWSFISRFRRLPGPNGSR